MVDTTRSTFNLGLPAIPETKDPNLFYELVKVYNALKLLAQGTDTYTSDGTIVASLADITSRVENLINLEASLAELRKKYFRYTVPKFTVTGPTKVATFGCNGMVPSAAVHIVTAVSAAPAGGTGTVVGAWDTAANRDSAIAAINSNSAAIAEIQSILKQFGLAN